MNPPALNVRNLSVSFQSATGPRQVVDNVSFSIGAAEATGLVGESGCGKTMTALSLLGLLPSAAATVRAECIEINGQDISALSAGQRRRVLGRDIAMIFQQPGTALDPVFKIGLQISAVYRRHKRGSRGKAWQAMLESLEMVGFSDPVEIADAYPHQLSGGMQQLAMIAMATVCRPAVLVADEPTTALDNNSQRLVLQQLKRLQKEFQTAILLVSHDLSVVRQCCHKVMVMYCGRLLEKSDCDSLYKRPRHPYSAGLLSCIPQISATRPAAISAIPGQVPRSNELPAGCHFAPRCNHVEPRCRQEVPVFESAASGDVACFKPLS